MQPNVGTHAHLFMGKEAPIGYVAGLGRGGPTRGFTTGSDVVPLQPGEFTNALNRIQQKDPLLDGNSGGGDEEDDDESIASRSLKNVDEDEAGLLATGLVSAEDVEAAAVYDRINQRMASRTKLKANASAAVGERDPLAFAAEFADLKRKMSSVSDAEWLAIPEAAAVVKKKRRTEPDFELPMPDSVILAGLASAGTSLGSDAGAIDSFGTRYNNDISNSRATDIKQFGEAREKALDIRLSSAETSIAASGLRTSVDATGYLTGLQTSLEAAPSAGALNDIKKARALYKSIIRSNPANPAAWIAAAAVEEVANKPADARKMLKAGCKQCPASPELWLQRIRLLRNADPDAFNSVLHEAVRAVPHSIDVWRCAIDTASDASKRQKLYKRALELNPKSSTLWMAFIEEEESEERAALLLKNAIECNPDCVDFWLALARLETYENAKKLINKARASCPPTIKIWLFAARLEEAHANAVGVRAIIKKAIADLRAKSIVLQRSDWIGMAWECEASGHVLCADAIIESVLCMGHETASVQTCKKLWLQDVAFCVERRALHTARFFFKHAIAQAPSKRSLWKHFVLFEQQHGTSQTLEAAAIDAVTQHPDYTIIWLLWAKNVWQTQNDAVRAHAILSDAHAKQPDAVELVLALFKIKCALAKVDEAQALLREARDSSEPDEDVWLKSIVLERNMGNSQEALSMTMQAISLFPQNHKLHIIRSQLLESVADLSAATEALNMAIKAFPQCDTLYVLASRMEMRKSPPNTVRARSVLETGRSKNTQSAALWLKSVEFECESQNLSGAKTLLAKALQECPTDGQLLSMLIRLEARPTRHFRAVDVLKKAESDPFVNFEMAKVFWADQKVEKALLWFDRAISFNKETKCADLYLFYYIFVQNSKLPSKTELLSKLKQEFVSSNAKYGTCWLRCRKDPVNWMVGNADVFDKALLFARDALLAEPYQFAFDL